MHKLLMIAAGGAIGAASRYLAAGWALRVFGAGFPYGTLTVNSAGSFLIGLLWALSAEALPLSANMKALIFVGFLGGFTTFSTYSLETLHLASEGNYAKALFNILSNNILCLAMTAAGFAIARYIAAPPS